MSEQDTQQIIRLLAAMDKHFQATLEAHASTIREVAEEFPRHIDDLKDEIREVMLLILDKMENPEPTKEQIRNTAKLRDQIIGKRIDSLEEQLLQHHDNVNALEEESVEYGSEVPLRITNQIIRGKEAIIRVEAELEYFRDLRNQEKSNTGTD